MRQRPKNIAETLLYGATFHTIQKAGEKRKREKKREKGER